MGGNGQFNRGVCVWGGGGMPIGLCVITKWLEDGLGLGAGGDKGGGGSPMETDHYAS